MEQIKNLSIKLLNNLPIPTKLNEATSSKMLISISYNDQIAEYEKINNHIISINEIEQFIHDCITTVSIKEQLWIINLFYHAKIAISFGMLLKINDKYENINCYVNLDNYFTSSGIGYAHEDHFTTWSMITLKKTYAFPQINNDGQFIYNH